MIFKFDKSGNMENMRMEGDFDMGRKGNKDKFQQVDVNVVNQVKEEVLGMVNEAASQTAVGYQEAMDENDEDMVQQHETELVKEMESESDRIWDRGVKDGVVGDSVDNDESDKSVMSDEELKQKMRERNMGNVVNMSDMPTLSNLTKKTEELQEWELENCSPVLINKKIGKYSTQMSCGLLATMVNEGKIYYNENTQRSRKKKLNGETTPYLMASKVKKIYEELISGELNGMLITLNSRIIKDEEGNILNPLSFDEDSGTLTGSGVLDAVDGWHRISGCVLMLKKWNIKKNQKTMPSPWDYEFIVAIEHKEEVKAGLIFKEYGSMQLKIQPSKIKFLDVYDYTNMIVRRLMTGSLRERVEIDKTRTKGTNNIVTFGTLSDAIKKNFKITTEDDVNPISNHLNKFFNKLINLFPEYFGNVSKEERDLMREKNDLTLELLMFHGYIAISSRLYGKEDWESKLSKLKSIIQVGSWRGHILQSDCPIWDRIFKGGDEKRIVNGSSSVSYVSKVMADYIEFGIDYAIKNIKEDDQKKLEKLNK